MFRSFLRPIAALATLAGLAAYATIMLRGPQGLSALAEKRKQIRTLEEENDNLARDGEERKKFIERLKHDANKKRLAVQKLGCRDKHDTQFKVTGRRITPLMKEPKPAKK